MELVEKLLLDMEQKFNGNSCLLCLFPFGFAVSLFLFMISECTAPLVILNPI